mgnify:CR=1 FL=1
MPGNTIDSCQGLMAPQSIIAMFYLILLWNIVLRDVGGKYYKALSVTV